MVAEIRLFLVAAFVLSVGVAVNGECTGDSVNQCMAEVKRLGATTNPDLNTAKAICAETPKAYKCVADLGCFTDDMKKAEEAVKESCKSLGGGSGGAGTLTATGGVMLTSLISSLLLFVWKQIN